MNVKYTYSHYMGYATNKNMTGNNSICRHALSTLILHRDNNLTTRHQKGTEYSASKLIRKGKPVTAYLNLQLMNKAEHIKSAHQNRLLSTITPEGNWKQPEQCLES